jgi:predicted phosphoribosyltransferase
MINAERSINKVLNDTQKVSKIFTMDTEKQVEEEVEEVEEVEEEIIKEENVQNNESESIISIDMGEGMKARIQTSELEKLKQ